MQQWSITFAVHYYYSSFIVRFQILSPQTPDLKMHDTEYNPTDDSRGQLFSLASAHFQVLDPAHSASLQGCLWKSHLYPDVSLQLLPVDIHGVSTALDLADPFWEETGTSSGYVVLGTCSLHWVGWSYATCGEEEGSEWLLSASRDLKILKCQKYG